MDIVEKNIKEWEKHLLDLGKKNRLVNYRDTKRSSMRVVNPLYDVLYEGLVNHDKTYSFSCPKTYDYDDDEKENAENIAYIKGDIDSDRTILEQQRTLHALRGKARTAINEQGINILYLTFGLLHYGEDTFRNDVLAPLVLVPVTLTVESLIAPYKLCLHDDEIVSNPTLIYKMQSEYGIEFPEFDSQNDELDTYFNKVEELIKGTKWALERTVTLSLLSFLKINMYKDLKNNVEKLKGNNIIRGICGDSNEVTHVPEELLHIDLDNKINPIDSFQVVDADSSQMDAIELSRKGHSFVLQGPPGTGKSQTITNIISEALANGKKVLFVSEKSAALDVVYNRLSQAGLADFCLVLHSHKTNKKEVLGELNKSLNLGHIQVREEALQQLKQLQQERLRLNQYTQELHTIVEPLHKTVYEVNGILSTMDAIPNLVFQIDDVRSATPDSLSRNLSIIKEFSRALAGLGQKPDESPWQGITLKRVTFEVRHDLTSHFNALLPALRELSIITKTEFPKISFREDVIINELPLYMSLLRHCKERPKVAACWTAWGDNYQAKYEELTENANNMLSLTSEMEQYRLEVQKTYSEKIFDINADDYRASVDAAATRLKQLLSNSFSETDSLFANRIVLTARFCEYEHSLSQMVMLANRLTQETGISTPICFSDFETVANICSLVQRQFSPSPIWFDGTGRSDSMTIIAEAIEAQNRINDTTATLNGLFLPDIFNVDASQILKRFKVQYVPLFAKLGELSDALGLRTPRDTDTYSSINELCRLIASGMLAGPDWFTNEGIENAKRSIAEAEGNQKRLAILINRLTSEYDKKILLIDADGLLYKFNSVYNSFFKRLGKAYKNDRNKVLNLRHTVSGKNASDTELISTLKEVKECREIGQWFTDNNERMTMLFGARFVGAETDFRAINNAIEKFCASKNVIFANKSKEVQSYLTESDHPAIIDQYVLQLESDQYLQDSTSYMHGYMQDISAIRACLRSDNIKEDFDDEQILFIMKQVAGYQSAQIWFEQNDKNLMRACGKKYVGVDTQFNQIVYAIDLTAELIELCGETVPVKLQSILCEKECPALITDYINYFQDSNWSNIEKSLKADLSECPSAVNETQAEVQNVQNVLGELSALIDRMNALRKDPDDSYSTLYSSLSKLSAYQRLVGQINSYNLYCQTEYGSLYSDRTSWKEIIAALDWTKNLYEESSVLIDAAAFVQLALIDETAAMRCGELLANLNQFFNEVHTEIKQLDSYFETEYQFSTTTISSAINRLQLCQEGIAELEYWVDYKKAVLECEEVGLSDFVSEILLRNEPSLNIEKTFLKRFFRLWLDSVIPEFDAIGGFRRDAHEQIISDFRELDTQQQIIARSRVKERLLNTLPDINRPTVARDEIGILKRELNKQRRVMPLRKLFSNIPTLLPTLKPCLMMSPLTVSLFLQSDNYSFDLIVFDEASQVRTENAVGAIMRGKQVVIAGDNKQLPPTNFFANATASGDDEADDELDDVGGYESILDEALTCLPEQTLRWHYRSRNESLIAFSNAKIYNNSLITFPSPDNENDEDGVKYIYVSDGTYDRGGKKNNIKEAMVVAKLVLQHFQTHPERSLGVITFSESQQDAIEAAIVKLRLTNPEYEDYFNEDNSEPFFVKNLENVQGDERDTIIFSVGYAKDTHGVMYMNFGPLSQTGGYRRLNVAITRAKYCIKLVSSIQPTDIQIDKTNSEGVRLLRSYMEFASIGPSYLNQEPQYSDTISTESPFEESVYNFLASRGYNVITQVGCSGYRIDMAVLHPEISGRFVLGIECDGATYHSARTARERDRLRQLVLENMGWKLYRVWSTDWVKDPITEGNRLTQAIDNAISNYTNCTENQTSISSAISTTVVESDANNQNSLFAEGSESRYEENKAVVEADCSNTFGFAYYEETDIWSVNRTQYNGTAFASEVICEIVKQEEPIYTELLYKRMAPLYGRQKVTDTVRSNVINTIKYYAGGKVKLSGSFYITQDYENAIPRIPREGNTPRTIEQISPDEIKAMMTEIVRQTYGISRDNLLITTARELGYKRVGSTITMILKADLCELLESEKIQEIEGKLSVC